MKRSTGSWRRGWSDLLKERKDMDPAEMTRRTGGKNNGRNDASAGNDSA